MLAGVRAGMVGLTLVTAITAMLIAPPGPVGADQVSDLKTQAAQISQDLVLEQLQVGAFQQQYDVDLAKVQRDEADIGSSENQIQADVSRVNRDRRRLDNQAVWAYIDLDPKLVGTPAMFEGNPNEAIVREQYEELANGDITLTIDDLHTDEEGLRAERTTLERQEEQDQATTSQEATLANAAHQTEVELESKQSEITGELAAAVAQQQAAQAAAAAAAVRAAQAAAAVATSATSVSSNRTTTSATQLVPSVISAPGQGSTASTSDDPSLPPFLQCVLQAESSGNYGAVSPGGTYLGGFQFSQATWNQAAALAGMPQLINVPPNEATPAQQDDLAIALYEADGEQPWYDPCRSN